MDMNWLEKFSYILDHEQDYPGDYPPAHVYRDLIHDQPTLEHMFGKLTELGLYDPLFMLSVIHQYLNSCGYITMDQIKMAYDVNCEFGIETVVINRIDFNDNPYYMETEVLEYLETTDQLLTYKKDEL